MQELMATQESNPNATEGPALSEVGPSTKRDSVDSFDRKLIRRTALSMMFKNTDITLRKPEGGLLEVGMNVSKFKVRKVLHCLAFAMENRENRAIKLCR